MSFKEWMNKQYFSLYLKEKLYCEYEEFLDAVKQEEEEAAAAAAAKAKQEEEEE